MASQPSPFLAVPAEQHLAGNDLCFALRDGDPVSPGQALVVPRFDGDVEDPTGGVRHAVVGRGHYRLD